MKKQVYSLVCAAFAAVGPAFAGETGLRSGDTVVFCGDSITCLANCNAYGYRHQLTNALAQVRGWKNVKAVNLGFCGNGVENWINIEKSSRTCLVQANDHSRAYPAESVGGTFSNKVDVAVISLGMNDVLCPFLGDGEADAARWIASYRTLVRNLRARVHPRVLAVTTIPPLTNDPDGAKNRVEARLGDGIRRLAAEEGVVLVDYHAALMRALGAIRRRSTTYQDTPDFVHPRELGNIAMAAELTRALGDADLAAYLETRFAARLAALVPAEQGGIAYRVFPRALEDVSARERAYDVAWTEVATGAQGRETVRLVPERAVNLVKVHGADVRIPAPWRVSEPMKKGATLADVKTWKTLAPTCDYVGHDDPQSVDYMQAWFGTPDDTFFAVRRVWSAKARSLPFRFKTDAFSNTYEFTVWLNGAEIWRTKLPRGTQRTADSSVLELKAGWNDLVIRNDHASWQRQFAVEYLPQAGDDLADLRYDATLPAK